MERKDFIKSCGRIVLLGGITASVGYLVVNNRVTASCSISPTCKNCGEFTKCELPQAKEVKEKRKAQ